MGRKPTADDLEQFKQQLTLLRGLLAGDISDLELDAFGDGEKAGVDALADGGSDSFHQELSLELLQRDESTLGEIDEALERIGDGSYGRCEECSTWIKKTRLKAVPHARLCIDCQRSAEEHG